MEYHFIYLIQEKIYIDENIDVYKIGKSTQENTRRVKSYPSGSKLYIQLSCNNCHLMEKNLINIFKTKFKLYRGREYFLGNLESMMNIIYNEIKDEHYISEYYTINDNNQIISEENSKFKLLNGELKSKNKYLLFNDCKNKQVIKEMKDKISDYEIKLTDLNTKYKKDIVKIKRLEISEKEIKNIHEKELNDIYRNLSVKITTIDNYKNTIDNYKNIISELTEKNNENIVKIRNLEITNRLNKENYDKTIRDKVIIIQNYENNNSNSERLINQYRKNIKDMQGISTMKNDSDKIKIERITNILEQYKRKNLEYENSYRYIDLHTIFIMIYYPIRIVFTYTPKMIYFIYNSLAG